MNIEKFYELLNNRILLCAVIAWFAAQGYKVISTLVTEKRLNFERIMGSGGMPSSHSASMTAVTVAVGKMYGFDTGLFALASIITFIVMYDAANVRMAAGKQAKVLNKLMKDLSEDISSISYNEQLRELLGHTYLEVFVGGVLGLVIGLFVV